MYFKGHEACKLSFQASQWHLEGAAVFVYETQPCLLSYHITCDDAWNTLSARVAGWVGDRVIGTSIRMDETHHWWQEEMELRAVVGCRDIDLNFSPSTNTIAIQRLKLAIGEKGELTAAWLKFPSFTIEPLIQSYQRLEQNRYRYESNQGSFIADLEVDAAGLVIDYPGIWEKVG